LYQRREKGKDPEEEKERTRECYARVSSAHQKEDLERQIEQLKKDCPSHELIQDIGSGLNWHRKGFATLLDRILSGSVEEVMVAYKDRLCRFGYELIEQMCKKFDTKLVVLNKDEEGEKNTTTELSEDLLSIVTVFVARNNGLRAGKNRKKRKERQEGGAEEEIETDDNKGKNKESL
jgi:predicted site-specific integrase-resolvase